MVVHSALWCWRIWSLWSRRCHIWLQRTTLGSYSENLFLGLPVKYKVLSQAENIWFSAFNLGTLADDRIFPFEPYNFDPKPYILPRSYILKNRVFYFLWPYKIYGIFSTLDVKILEK